MVDPLLKWPGSKLARRANLAALFADDPRPVFCDPMCGSMSVPLAMPLCDRGAVVLGDAGPRLIATYRAVRRDPEGVHRALSLFAQGIEEARATAAVNGWVSPSASANARKGRYSDPWKAYYYRQRTRMNEWAPVQGEVASAEHAALFLWVQRAAFNGLFRTGPDGGSNTPAGDRFTLPSLRHLGAVAHHLRGVTLLDAPLDVTARVAQTIGPVDLLLDPPYAGDYDGYTAAGFTDAHRADLVRAAQETVRAGGRVVVTEADHPVALEWLAAAGLHVQHVVGRTTISRSSAQRGDKAELLARSWPW